MTKEEQDVRQEVARRIRGMMDRRKSFKLPTVCKGLVRDLLTEPKFIRQFAAAMLYSMVYDIAMKTIGDLRGSHIGDLFVSPHDLGRAKELTQPAVFGRINRWLKHFEHCGEQYVQLLNLTDSLACAAIAERYKRRDAEDRIICLLEQLKAPLKGEQTIGDYWTPEQIDALYQTILNKGTNHDNHSPTNTKRIRKRSVPVSRVPSPPSVSD